MGIKDLNDPWRSGRVLAWDPGRKDMTVLMQRQAIPDSIGIHHAQGKIYWTNMGSVGAEDGSIMSCTLDGREPRTIVSSGRVHTPKQLFIDEVNDKIYFADREGLQVGRCNLDGSSLEVLIETGNRRVTAHRNDPTRWCVGIAVSLRANKLFWTQKGPPRGGTGRILCADLEKPVLCHAWDRPDVVELAEKLPEPIDLAYDESTRTLYWTDRGDPPYGNSLNALGLEPARPGRYDILARTLHEPIGFALDTTRKRMLVAGVGGDVYHYDIQTGRKRRVYQGENCAFSGICIGRAAERPCMSKM